MASSLSSINCRFKSRHNAFNQASSFGFNNPPSSSTEKAHRVATLKTRFADIISKAEQTLNNNGQREDQVRLRQEKADCAQKQQKKKRGIESSVIYHQGINEAGIPIKGEDFVEKQQEKKRRIVVRIKIPKATTDKRNSEHKMEIEKEREATRLALEKVEASVYVDDWNQTFGEFMMLITSQPGLIK